MKNNDELTSRKEKAETLNKKTFHELTEEELAHVTGGGYWRNGIWCDCSHPGFYKCKYAFVDSEIAICSECTHWQEPKGPCDLD